MAALAPLIHAAPYADRYLLIKAVRSRFYIILDKFKVCRNNWLLGVAKNVPSRDSTIKNLRPSTALQQHWNSSIGQRWNSSIGGTGAALLGALEQLY